MMKKKSEQQLEWLEKEKIKDKIQLEKDKLSLINEIKKHKKEEILPKKVKLSLWSRIKKVLMG
jgi:ATP-dependent protease ClpP protease subunit